MKRKFPTTISETKKYLDEKYPDREHFCEGKGWYFVNRNELEVAKKYDTKFYSGMGCITFCPECKNPEYLPPLPKSLYDFYLSKNWEIPCFKHLEKGKNG